MQNWTCLSRELPKLELCTEGYDVLLENEILCFTFSLSVKENMFLSKKNWGRCLLIFLSTDFFFLTWMIQNERTNTDEILITSLKQQKKTSIFLEACFIKESFVVHIKTSRPNLPLSTEPEPPKLVIFDFWKHIFPTFISSLFYLHANTSQNSSTFLKTPNNLWHFSLQLVL